MFQVEVMRPIFYMHKPLASVLEWTRAITCIKFGKPKYGAPQGSVLGSLLFRIYLNELPNAITFSQPLHFADNTYLLNIQNIISRSTTYWVKVILFKTKQKACHTEFNLKFHKTTLHRTNYIRYLAINILNIEIEYWNLK